MAKELNKFQKRCEDCASLVIKCGKWYCDECFGQPCEEIDDCPDGVTLEDVIALEEKAKDVKIEHGASAETKKKRKAPERKPDLEKEEIVRKLSEFLENLAENVTITNVSKVVEFEIGENHYKLDLIRQRKPKK